MHRTGPLWRGREWSVFGLGEAGGAHHVFFIYVDCLNVSQARDVGVGVMEAANPEFQVVRERE